jgi:8-oxo-dGTP pyrophosphatase MutT (NUDIX family)
MSSAVPAGDGPGAWRGGAQRIPRPAEVLPGDPPPWAALTEADRQISMEQIRATFEALGPAVRSPREGHVDRASAVLAAVYEDAGETWIILTRRSAALRVHSGEVSFPGGGQDDGEDLRDTAQREACEEIGLDSSLVEIIGELDHLSTITSNSFIVPYVALLAERPVLHPSPAEVAAVLTVRLSELLDPATYREERWILSGEDWSLFFFELDGDTVWGATAAMLRQLLGFVTGTVERGGMAHT